ncbi:virulence associated lipoprotein (plasmid) [Borreliella sinica]|uniref:virulence associated lipoprotein n=1 Tax=Borreliella sinica TaxID=87162 RepID=UPI003AEFC637
MKNHIIVYIFIFLFLNACTPDFKINQGNAKYPSNEENSKSNSEASSDQKKEERERNKKILFNNLINLIESANAYKEKYIKKMEKEPSDQYGMLSAFADLNWVSAPGESMSSNTDRSIKYRRRVYITLSLIDDKELKKISDILRLAGQTLELELFRVFVAIGYLLEEVTNPLYSKKDVLYKLSISDLDKLKKLFNTILSTIKFVSEKTKQILLDYQDDKNLIKTDVTKLKSYLDAFCKQMREETVEAENLLKEVISLVESL